MDVCEFCERLNQRQQDRPWYDFHIIDKASHFVTIAPIGALVPGYVLIVPRAHVFSMASLNRARRLELDKYERHVHERIAHQWRAATLFEHGACADEGGRTGACISHAHWHLVPGCYDLDGQGVTFQRVATFEAIVGADREQGYLAFRTPSDEWYFNAIYRPPSQYFRRLVAAQLGQPANWDYLGFPMLDSLRETITRFTGREPVDW